MNGKTLRPIVLVAVLLGAAAYIVGVYLPGRQARETFNAAAAHLEAGEYGEAVELLDGLQAAAARDEALAKMLPGHLARAHAGRGEARAAAGDLAGAIEDFEAAGRHDPQVARARGLDGRIASLRARMRRAASPAAGN
jgi:regulator of sirC expression with transglutaminase-like and TPR domain